MRARHVVQNVDAKAKLIIGVSQTMVGGAEKAAEFTEAGAELYAKA